MNFLELPPIDFKQELEQNKNAMLIDVREAYEYEDLNIGGSNIPMGEILDKIENLQGSETILLCCKTGKRSKTVAYHLSNHLPSKKIISLEGGIEAYGNLNG